MVVFPNAKINIGLSITGKRPDGYHDIETVMVPVPWRDVLEIVPSAGGETSLTVYGRSIDCPMEKNLVIKAYRRLCREAEMPPVDIYLQKIIPDGAGLGGGSADAAFTLKALNDMFSLGFSDNDLAGIAASIGADCPFFIYNRPMLATGTGTELAAVDGIPLPGKWIVVAKPPVAVSTAEAYRGVSLSVSCADLRQVVKGDISGWARRGLKNDFEASIFPKYPEIRHLKEQMLDRGALYASMSGSGAAVYGIFDDDKLAETARGSFGGLDLFCARL